MAKKVVKVEKKEVKVAPVKKPIVVVKKKTEPKKVEVKPVVKPKPEVKKKVTPVVKVKPTPKVEVKETLPPRVIRTFVPGIKKVVQAEIKAAAIPEVVPEKKLVLPGIPQKLTDKLVQLKKALQEKEQK